MTPFSVTLGENLETLGDNPFAMCVLEPFAIVSNSSFHGVERTEYNYNYQISDHVSVIDGSLYCKVANGLELIAYAGVNPNVQVAEDTVRITAYAFAGSDVQMVTMPYSTTSIGHKAFFDCEDLHTVVFGSYYAPILEEEFDPAYYESYKHIPGAGNYGEYTDYDGTYVSIDGFELLPWYMWNVTGAMYSNVFYGANFVDYVGYVEDKLTMVRPVNGKNYDSYIYSQYFDMTIDGAQAPDKAALAAIKLINALPERVSYEDKAMVEAAREAYNKIATFEQMAQVTNYATLVSAEQRIIALTPEDERAETQTPAEETTSEDTTAPVETPEKPEKPEGNKGTGALVVILTLLAMVAAGTFFYLKKTHGDNAMAVFKESCAKAGSAVKSGCGKVVAGLKAKTAAAKESMEAKKAAKAAAAEAVEETPVEEASSEEAVPEVEVSADEEKPNEE